MRNLIAVIIFLFWIPVTLVAQINREFKTAKVYGDVAQATEKLYENVPLDPAGVPILNQAPTQESLNFYENGQMIETQQFDIEKGEKTLSVRILLKRKAGTVHTADVYTYYSGKESLLRSHVGTIENGRLVSEKIIKKQKEIGVFQYFYSTNTQGLEVERIETKDDRVHGKYYTESDKFGTVLSLQIFENDTIMRQILLDRQGEEYSKYLLISSSRSTGRIDSVLVTERNWLDSNGNTTLNLKQMEALTTPPDGEPRTANFVVAFSYVSSKNAPKKVQTSATEKSIVGAWKSEAFNIELFFQPASLNEQPKLYGRPYLSKSNEPSVEKLLADGEIWKYMLKQDYLPSTWAIDKIGALTVTLKNGSVLLFSTELEHKTLVLKPTKEGMKGELRLAKSN